MSRGEFLLEATRQVRRPRTIGAALVIVVAEALVCVLVGISHRNLPERIGDWGSLTPASTGLALPLVSLNAMALLAFPFAAAFFAGDAVAGDVESGSLRYLLARDVARWRVLGAKALTAGALSLACMLLAFVVSLVGSVVAFGWNPLTVVNVQRSTVFSISSAGFTPAEGLWRALAAIGLVALSTAAVFGFALLLSTWTDRSFVAVAGAVGLTFASRALDNVPGLQHIAPWLPVGESGTTAWSGMFFAPVASGAMVHLLIVQAAYLGAFAAVAFARFQKLDLLA